MGRILTGLGAAVLAALAGAGSAFADIPPVHLPGPAGNPLVDPQTGATPGDPMADEMEAMQAKMDKAMWNPEFGRVQYFYDGGKTTFNPEDVKGRTDVKMAFEFNGKGGIAPQTTMPEPAQAGPDGRFIPASQAAQQPPASDAEDAKTAQDPAADEGAQTQEPSFQSIAESVGEGSSAPAGDGGGRTQVNGLNIDTIGADKATNERVMRALAEGHGLDEPETGAHRRGDDFRKTMAALSAAGGVPTGTGWSASMAPAGTSGPQTAWKEILRLVGIERSLRSGSGERPAVAGYGEDESLPQLGPCAENAPTAFGRRNPDCPPKI